MKKTSTKPKTNIKAVKKPVAVKPKADQQEWFLINAENQVLGRLAVKLANILSGKNKPSFERHRDNGAFVVVVNARKIRITGRKAKQKTYKHFSGYPGGLNERSYEKVVEKKCEYPLMHAVKGMLPKNSMGNHMMTKLRVYPDSIHPHAAQQPKELKA